jgi:hypothetical protein
LIVSAHTFLFEFRFNVRYASNMTATAVIEEIKHLPPGEQLRVIQFAVELARTRRLAGSELSALAQRMVESDDLAEVEKLKSALAHGFYGN